jgi:hypothetical protein
MKYILSSNVIVLTQQHFKIDMSFCTLLMLGITRLVILVCYTTTTTTKPFILNQAFYSQASWDRLEMKPHKQKKQVQNKSEKEGENKG